MDVFLILIAWLAILSLPSIISNIVEKNRRETRDKATQDLLTELCIIPNKLAEKYKPRLDQLFGRLEITKDPDWLNDPDWFNNAYFKKGLGWYPKHRYAELEIKCPDCENGFLRVRKGQYGKFLGCSAYPKCKYTKNFEIAKEEYRSNINNDFIEDMREAYL
ncbi:topoisomerase DNA-binding C4 zinc finger domain-containing protein [Patescibacteria group bacterium]|nr:topoisomerase DNA-binding C4 zinc finger domain-containing protein [Patescibacteria group bacterium]